MFHSITIIDFQTCALFTTCMNPGNGTGICQGCSYGQEACSPVYDCDRVGMCQGETQVKEKYQEVA